MKLAIKHADLGPDVLFCTYRAPGVAALILNTEVLVNRFRFRAAIRRLAQGVDVSQHQRAC